jgi:hypothetical protein
MIPMIADDLIILSCYKIYIYKSRYKDKLLLDRVMGSDRLYRGSLLLVFVSVTTATATTTARDESTRADGEETGPKQSDIV